MAYATRGQFELRFGAAEIADLAGDPDAPGVDRTTRALEDASAIIDAHIGAAYALPLPNGTETRWLLLREIACDLARAELYDDSIPDRVEAVRDRAMKRLEALRDGKLALVGDDGTVMPRRNVAQRTGPEPAVTGGSLAGF